MKITFLSVALWKNSAIFKAISGERLSFVPNPSIKGKGHIEVWPFGDLNSLVRLVETVIKGRLTLPYDILCTSVLETWDPTKLILDQQKLLTAHRIPELSSLAWIHDFPHRYGTAISWLYFYKNEKSIIPFKRNGIIDFSFLQTYFLYKNVGERFYAVWGPILIK